MTYCIMFSAYQGGSQTDLYQNVTPSGKCTAHDFQIFGIHNLFTKAHFAWMFEISINLFEISEILIKSKNDSL